MAKKTAAKSATSEQSRTPTKFEPSPQRVANIEEILARRGSCTCDIRSDMTDDELMRVQSCTRGSQCSILDSIRRKVVDYNRHWID